MCIQQGFSWQYNNITMYRKARYVRYFQAGRFHLFAFYWLHKFQKVPCNFLRSLCLHVRLNRIFTLMILAIKRCVQQKHWKHGALQLKWTLRNLQSKLQMDINMVNASVNRKIRVFVCFFKLQGPCDKILVKVFLEVGIIELWPQMLQCTKRYGTHKTTFWWWRVFVRQRYASTSMLQ